MLTEEQKYMKAQIHDNLRLKNTDELLSIWRQADHDEWTDLAFEVVKEILLERLGQIPAQESIIKHEPIEQPGDVQTGQGSENLAPTHGEIKKFLRQQTYETMDGMETDELIEIWQEADHEAWTDLAFEVLQQILMERIGHVPEQNPQEQEFEEEEDDEQPEGVLEVDPGGDNLAFPDVLGGLFGLRCPDCGKGISDQDRVCPHCGVDLEEPLDEAKLQSLAADELEKAQHKFDQGRDLTGALVHCDQALEYTPDSAPAHNLRGVILDALGNGELALKEYKEALRLDPRLSDARDNLADAEAEIKSADELIVLQCSDCGGAISEQDEFCPHCGAHFDEKPEEDEPQPLAADLLEKAEKYLDEGRDLQEALNDCDQALEQVPNSARAHNLRGLILDGLGKTGLAIKEYQEALRLDPGLTDARGNLTDAEADLKSRQN